MEERYGFACDGGVVPDGDGFLGGGFDFEAGVVGKKVATGHDAVGYVLREMEGAAFYGGDVQLGSALRLGEGLAAAFEFCTVHQEGAEEIFFCIYGSESKAAGKRD